MSKIISFDWTTPALLAGRKTCTRRDWLTSYAEQFKADEVCQAWDHLPRTRKGRKVGDIRITVAPYWELLADMPDSDYEEEGFQFFEEYPHLLPEKAGPMGISFEAFVAWRSEPGGMYVVRLKLEDIVKDVLRELESLGHPVAHLPGGQPPIPGLPLATPRIPARWTHPSDREAIAREWDHLVESLGDYPTRRAAFRCLMGLCTAYARAQGIRVGTVASFDRNGMGLINAMAEVMELVVNRRNDWRYEELVKLGYGDAETVNEIVSELREGRVS